MSSSSAENLRQQIAEELSRAQVGDDDGLLPVYSLLGELGEQVTDESTCLAIEHLRNGIEALFERSGVWCEATIEEINKFLMEGGLSDATTDTPTNRAIDQNPDEISISETPPKADSPSVSNAIAPPPPPLSSPAPTPPTIAQNEDSPLTLDLEDNRELLEEFVNEACEHLDQVEEALLKIDHDPNDRDSVHALFRSFHTIKGVSGFLQLKPVNVLSHDVESLLDLARNDRLVLDEACISLLLEARDLLARFIRQIQVGLAENVQPTEIIPISPLIASVRARSVLKNASAASSASQSAPAKSSLRGSPPEPAVIASPAPSVVPTPDPQPEPAVTASAPTQSPVQSTQKSAGTEIADTTVRVRIDKLDQLFDSVGELVILEAQLINAIGEVDEDSLVQKHMNQLRRIVRGIQKNAMSMRMVPVRPTFRKMERLCRDLGRNLGKPLNMVLNGEDTELDRTMVEFIADPLVHMIRNAVDHGIEPQDERRAANKPDHGTITLSAFHQGGNITLRLEDDGRGLDVQKIRARALARNLIHPNQELSDFEIQQLIFLPGFSTASALTDISGRGVGLDVVRRNIDRLRGKVEIESTPGQGSVFTIKLPLTLAIIDGLIVKVAEDTYILPATSVRVSLQPSPTQIKRLHGRSETLTLRDEIIPLYYLNKLLDIDTTVRQATDGIVVVVDSFTRTYGLVVDELVSKQEVVIKSLGPITRNVNGILGGAILGDGSIALILDTMSILNLADDAVTSAAKAS